MPLKRGRSTAVNLATFMSFIASRRTCKVYGERKEEESVMNHRLIVKSQITGTKSYG